MMTLDDAIKRAEEDAKEQDKLCKRYDDASGYSRSHDEDIRTTDAKRCEKCAEEHRQIAEWLKDYKRLLEQEPCEVEAAKLQQSYNKGFEDCRQTVLDTMSELNAISFYEAQEDSKECYYEIRQAVKNMSPVRPQEPIPEQWQVKIKEENVETHC